ncbi:aldehyde dehydrogenase family 3 member H1 isoform X3 [Morus notabilis]|uniref:aldehyde dehydrogenase family 3 member H1 isoform X1 n=1 Tax=Morus notabilis TaxID=981085 RepID=UPI000CED1D90|nr:aldehyde dehydrogenase family 3 member H1 isoform X1 [Morus notabilis]XP_024019183.1 aldehyde dehydrogenase family 3 member H1 isoform X3 [Morus notabilis]
MKGLCIQLSHHNSIENRLFHSRRSTRTAYKNPTKFSIPYFSVSSSSSFPKISCIASTPLTTEVEEKLTFDVDEARLLVKELQNVFKSGKTKSYEWRVSQLKSIAKMLEEREKDITEALHKDLEKPELEAFISEISTSKSSCQHALQELQHWMAPEKVKTSITSYPSSAEIVSEPLGVVLVISTWNFPFLLSLDPVIGAISAGNAVVLKPSEVAPGTSSLLARLFEKYLDNSAIRVVEGAVPETTALLEQKWNKILYTGSARVGRIVMAAAAKHLTPVILELGGKCPAVVDSNLNLQVASRRIIAGKWALNNGQACIAIDYIITTKDFAPTLIDSLRRELEQSFGQNPLETRDVSRIVNKYHFSRLLKLLDEDKVSDKIVLGGQSNEDQLRIAPTILLDVPDDTEIMKEEIFGPFLPIVTVEKIEDSFDVINSRPQPLVAYLFTNNDQLKKDYVQNVSSGGMLVNDTVLHVTVDGLPFGGVGESGMGSYHGKFSFDGFSHKKSVMYRGFEPDASVRYPPYTPQKQRLLKALLSGKILAIIQALIGWF